MNKKAQPLVLEYTLRLIIAVLILFFIVSCAAQACKKLSPKAQQDAEKVFETIYEFSEQKENDFTFFPIKMDEQTAFLGFYANQEKISAKFGLLTITFERPKDNCKMENDCFCFCKKVEYVPAVPELNKFKCEFEDLTCVEGDFDYLIKTCEDLDNKDCIKEADGLLLFNKIKALSETFDTKRPDKSIYIEKVGSIIGICEELSDGVHCITLPTPTKTPTS